MADVFAPQMARQAALIKWEYVQSALTCYEGLVGNIKSVVKGMFAAKRLQNIANEVNKRVNDFTNREKEALDKIIRLRINANAATNKGNDLVQRINTIATNLLRLMSRSRQKRILNAAFVVFRKELDSLLPEIEGVNQELLKFADEAIEANSSVAYLKDAVAKSLREFQMICKADKAKARGKAYSGATGVTVLTGIVCYLVPPVTLAIGIATTCSVGAASFGTAIGVTEFMTIPEIEAHYKDGLKHMEALEKSFENMATDTREITVQMKKKQQNIIKIREALHSSNSNARDALELDDGMFECFYDLLKEDLEATKNLCTEYLSTC